MCLLHRNIPRTSVHQAVGRKTAWRNLSMNTSHNTCEKQAEQFSLHSPNVSLNLLPAAATRFRPRNDVPVLF